MSMETDGNRNYQNQHLVKQTQTEQQPNPCDLCKSSTASLRINIENTTTNNKHNNNRNKSEQQRFKLKHHGVLTFTNNRMISRNTPVPQEHAIVVDAGGRGMHRKEERKKGR